MSHRAQHGFALCNHTCQGSQCEVRRRGGFLWAKEGSAARRHATNAELHPGCKPPCPVAVSSRYTRNATKDDHAVAIRGMVLAGSSSKAIDDFFSKRIPSWNVGQVDWRMLITPRSEDHHHDDEEMEVDESNNHDSEEDDEDEDDENDEIMQGVTDIVPEDITRSSSRSISCPSDFIYSYGTHDVVPTVPRKIRLLYVPDPTRARSSREHAMVDLGWVRRHLTADQRKAISGLNGVQYKVTKPTKAERNVPGILTLLTEWLWLILCLAEYRVENEKLFEVTYMTWEDFKDVLAHPRANAENQQRWAAIRSQDCIIGGMDYTINTSSPNCAYNLHGAEREQYERTLSILAHVVPLWPSVPALHMAGHKWKTVKILEMAAHANGWARPCTSILDRTCDIPAGTVLKRSHSDCGECVVLPEQSIAGSGAAVDRARQRLHSMRTWSYLDTITHSQEETWVSQEYIETLVTLGEWRFFLVGGHVENIVHTFHGPDGHWVGRRVSSFLTLAELGELWKDRLEQPLTPERIVNPEGGDRRIRVHGANEVMNVVRESYEELVRQETNPAGAKSSLCILCRMDIGLMFDTDGNPSYFVNEVERSPTMSLWLRTVEDASMRGMVDTFARVLHSHLSDLADPYTY